MAAVKYCVVLVLLYSSPVTARTEVFHTNCTRPPSGFSYSFVSAPNTRGTLEIAWSCIFTLLICTWQVQHLNVPRLKDTGRVRLFFRKPLAMCFVLVFPEIIVATAAVELVQARRSVRYMQRELPNFVAWGGWTMTHAFYANMFGFMLRKRVVAESDLATTHIANNINAGSSRISQNDVLVLNTERMAIYLKSIPSLRVFITKADINCRAKGDYFLKCTAGFQVLWFIVQVYARLASNLPIALLEVVVSGYAICTVITYIFWAKKPLDVSLPTVLDRGREPLPISDDWVDNRDFLEVYQGTEISYGSNHRGSTFFPSGYELVYATALSVSGTLFGAIHISAWNYHFSKHVEKLLWRIFSVVATAIPAFLVPVQRVSKNDSIHWVLYLLYSSCRGGMIVLTFKSLRNLPAGVFATTWSTYIPHLT